MTSFKTYLNEYKHTPRFTGKKIPKDVMNAVPSILRRKVNGYDFTDKGIIISFDSKLNSMNIRDIEKGLGHDHYRNGEVDINGKYHMYHFRDYGEGY